MALDTSTEEAGDCPQYTGETPSAICSLLPQDLLMTGMLRNVLMRHFSHGTYIEHPSLRKLVWKDGDGPGILIESIHRWTPNNTELRPAVLVKRNDCDNMRRGWGDIRQGPATDKFGHEHYVTFWTGSHTLFCIGGTGGQAELLGTEVQRELTQFGPKLLQYLDLKAFRVLKRGAVGMVEEATQNFVVPVTVGYGFEERWVLRQQAPPLRHISLSLLAEC